MPDHDMTSYVAGYTASVVYCLLLMSTDNIRIARNGKTIGDFNLAGLGSALRNKSVLPTDHYWRNGMNSWERVSLIADEALAAAPAAPLSMNSKNSRKGLMISAGVTFVVLIAAVFYQLGKSQTGHQQPASHAMTAPPRGAEVRQTETTSSSPAKSLFTFGTPSTPLKSEFYRDKGGEVYFKVWINNDGDIPYDDFVWKITKIQAPDGRRFSNSYPVNKQLLLKGRFMNSHEWGGVNPYGSDCHPGDRFVIEIPKYGPLVIDAPDSAKGLKVLPY
jgi:hypothetical protein